MQVRGSDIAEAYEDTGADYGWEIETGVDRIEEYGTAVYQEMLVEEM